MNKDFYGNELQVGDLFITTVKNRVEFYPNYITGFTNYYVKARWGRVNKSAVIKASFAYKNTDAWDKLEQEYLSKDFHKFCSDNNIIKERLFEI